jgi:thymidylate synthase ThyX
MNVQLVWATPNAEEMIVKMARVSAPKNQDNMDTAPKLLRYLIKHQHWSPYEMANMCVEINTTRAISPQILRHRSFSFQEFCLAGNVRITISTESGVVQRLPIEELYSKWNKSSFRARYARSYDPEAERFISAPILSVYRSGEKPIYQYTIEAPDSYKTIDCTQEHRIFTKEKGFVAFKEAYEQGLSVALNGKETFPLPYQNPDVLKQNAWMGSTAFAEAYGIKDVTARKWFRKHGIVPAKPNNAASSRIDISFEAKKSSFMKWARSTMLQQSCERCGHDGSVSRLELSHITAHDNNEELCFDETNLQTLCASCHRKYDIAIQGKQYGWTLGMTAKWGKITEEKYLGIQMTYDIEMDHPTHNFVANGIVVHNSQRYADVSDVGSIILPHLRSQDYKNRQNSNDDLKERLGGEKLAHYYRRMSTILEDSKHLYQEMISEGIAKESARFVLPLAAPTRLYMNGTIRSYIHYLQLRTHESTQLEHREIAEAIKGIFCKEFPIIGEAVFSTNQ